MGVRLEVGGCLDAQVGGQALRDTRRHDGRRRIGAGPVPSSLADEVPHDVMTLSEEPIRNVGDELRSYLVRE